VLRTRIGAPEEVAVADAAEELVRHRRPPERDSGRSWTVPGRCGLLPPNFRAAVSVLRPWDCGMVALAPPPLAQPGVQLAIDPQADTYEQVIAALRASNGGDRMCEGLTPLS
jgi:hypothetical protein